MTMPTELESSLRQLLSQLVHAPVDDVSLDADLRESLGLDSLGGLRMLAAVEKHYRVRFPDEHLAEFRTLRAILDFLPGSKESSP